MSLPGTWLLALLARHLDEKTVESIVVPTVADLHHETLRAGTSVRAGGLRSFAATPPSSDCCSGTVSCGDLRCEG
jgi:hypothetical protein